MEPFKLILLYISSVLFLKYSYAQTAIYNEGDLQLHNDVQIGFHTNLINEGNIEINTPSNKGFAGFYSENELRTVSGSNRPVFYNVEVDAVNNLELQVSLGVTNEFNFITGKILTDRNNTGISLDFINHDLYANADNNSHVDGYASVKNYNDSFTFPIGDDDRLRTMILPNRVNNTYFKGAYFFENPNTPSNFGTIFNTDNRTETVKSVSNQEFWDLDGTSSTKITLTWDNQSNIFILAKTLSNLRVVGWSKTTNRWEDLGNTYINGNEDKGEITSDEFIPDNYEIITIGSIETTEEDICSANYLFSPNEDGVNETFEIDCIDEYPNNSEISVYNRWGNLVYRAKGYKNTWKGISDGRSTIAREKGLPVGTYFYMLKYLDINGKEQLKKGWVYINR